MIRTGSFTGDPADSIFYILEDHLGSSNVRLNTTGAVIDREEYYPFGDSSLRTWGKKRYRYVAKEKDNESGLYYYGMRYYASWTCRFISVDPLAGEYAQLTPYNNAGNNSITDKDIDGMQGVNTPESINNKPDSNQLPDLVDTESQPFNITANKTIKKYGRNANITIDSKYSNGEFNGVINVEFYEGGGLQIIMKDDKFYYRKKFEFQYEGRKRIEITEVKEGLPFKLFEPIKLNSPNILSDIQDAFGYAFENSLLQKEIRSDDLFDLNGDKGKFETEQAGLAGSRYLKLDLGDIYVSILNKSVSVTDLETEIPRSAKQIYRNGKRTVIYDKEKGGVLYPYKLHLYGYDGNARVRVASILFKDFSTFNHYEAYIKKFYKSLNY